MPHWFITYSTVYTLIQRKVLRNDGAVYDDDAVYDYDVDPDENHDADIDDNAADDDGNDYDVADADVVPDFYVFPRS